MPAKEIQLFGLGLHGKSPNVTANKLTNAYYEFQTERDRTKVAIYGTPGLTLFLDAGDTPWRGLHVFPGNSLLYGVHRGTFYSINNAGVTTSRGTIGTTTGRVSICDNGTQVAVVDGSEIYAYDTSAPATPIAAVADADRPISPNTCTFQGARILTDENNTGKFLGSGNSNVTSWAALDFATAESNPDNVVRVENYRGAVVLFGDLTTEFWQNVGGSGFPYLRVMGADAEYGLAARWSVGRFMGSLAFLAKNREGQIFVAMLDGFQARPISNFELDSIINGYGTKADATGFGYSLGGHPMYQLNFPTEGKSWLYDGSTNYWSELESSGSRHRAEIGVDFLNRTIVSDYSNGKLYIVDPDVYTENGTEIRTKLVGRHIFDRNMTFRLDSLELNGEFGVGLATGQGSDPQIMMRLSKDGGHSFGVEQWRSLGKVGEYANRARWLGLGMARDIVPEFTITDPVKRVFTTAVMKAEAGHS